MGLTYPVGGEIILSFVDMSQTVGKPFKIGLGERGLGGKRERECAHMNVSETLPSVGDIPACIHGVPPSLTYLLFAFDLLFLPVNEQLWSVCLGLPSACDRFFLIACLPDGLQTCQASPHNFISQCLVLSPYIAYWFCFSDWILTYIEWFGWAVLAWGFSWGCSQNVGQCCSHPRLDWDWKIFSQDGSFMQLANWGRLLVGRLSSVLRRPLHKATWVSSGRSGWVTRRAKQKQTYLLLSSVRSHTASFHWFCWWPTPALKQQKGTGQGRECQEARVSSTHRASCNHQVLSSLFRCYVDTGIIIQWIKSPM